MTDYDDLPDALHDFLSISLLAPSPAEIARMWVEGDYETRREIDGLLATQHALEAEIQSDCPARPPRAARWTGARDHDPT